MRKTLKQYQRESNMGEPIYADGVNVDFTDRTVVMATYDRLPSKVKEFLDSAPVEISPMEAERMLPVFGSAERLIEEYTKRLREFFPNWKPVERITK